MTARNERCPCGTGKKYKNCCGRGSDRPVALPDASRLIALAYSGRYEDMEKRARELVRADPQSGFAWKALSVSLEQQGKDALAALQRAALLLPQDVEAQSNLGSALRRAGRTDEAVECYGRALEIRPNIAEVWNNLGNAQKDMGRFDDALESFRRALALKPNFAKSHNNLGNTLQDLGRLDEAVASYRRAVDVEPDYAEAHNNLGIALRMQNRGAEAELSCRRALEIDPHFSGAVMLLSELHSDKGQFSAAEELLRGVIALEPESAEAWAGLVRLKRMTQADGAWLAEAQRIVGGGLALRREVHLRYALGKYFDDVGDYGQAFENYRRANELSKFGRPAHERSRVTEGIERIVRRYEGEWLSRGAAEANPAERPVFIVGMPRSGTTLAEQILAAHGEVFGAGELPFWNTAAAGREDGTRGKHVETGEDESDTLRSLAEEYLTELRGLPAEALRVVDKMPGNFLYLGLIHAALPKARIIHLRRNPLDTCLSIYFQNFGAMHSYANDLEGLAHYYGEYLRLMEHWRRTLPPQVMLEVPYEGLVEDPEAWSRRMIEFIGLAWDPNCLEFHRSSRSVSTFSKWQARQRINNSSVDRWRHYQPFLGPLRRLAENAPWP